MGFSFICMKVPLQRWLRAGIALAQAWWIRDVPSSLIDTPLGHLREPRVFLAQAASADRWQAICVRRWSFDRFDQPS